MVMMVILTTTEWIIVALFSLACCIGLYLEWKWFDRRDERRERERERKGDV
jgi:hypothetical protein